MLHKMLHTLARLAASTIKVCTNWQAPECHAIAAQAAHAAAARWEALSLVCLLPSSLEVQLVLEEDRKPLLMGLAS